MRLQPLDPQLRQHVDQVKVLLEIASGHVLKAETMDADGDRIVLSFTNIKVNTGLDDAALALTVPAGVTVSRPLEGTGGRPGVGSGK